MLFASFVFFSHVSVKNSKETSSIFLSQNFNFKCVERYQQDCVRSSYCSSYTSAVNLILQF